MKSIFLCQDKARPTYVYSKETISELKNIANLCETPFNLEYVRSNKKQFSDVKYIFSTWSMPTLTEDEIKDFFPALECVFYAAGTVQDFARPFLNCGIKVFSAWAANAVPVAEYTVAQIILANKGFFYTAAVMSSGDHSRAFIEKKKYPGNFGAKIGIIGAGMIGSLVIKMLKAYKLNVLVFDPFLSEEKAAELGVKKCSLEKIFAECNVVSNHLANNKQTKGMLGYDLFSTMPKYSTFLNTGRGAQVVEADLIKVLCERADIYAILDVTDPEPPMEESLFYKLPNCILTPHIAGSSGFEVNRMAEYMAEEFKLYSAKKPNRFEITMKMLETMA